MPILKLKNFTIGLILISLFFGGFLGFCNALSQDAHAAVYEGDYLAMAMVGKAASSCCEIHASKQSFTQKLALSTIENRNFGLGIVLLAFLMFGVLSLFALRKSYIAARIYYLRQIISIPRNHLLFALSQGILHPKIYNA